MSVNVMTLKPGDVVMVCISAHGWQDSGGSKRTTVRPARVIEVYRNFCTVLLYRGKQVIRESPHYDAIEAVNPEDVHLGSVPPMPGSEEARLPPEPAIPYVEPDVIRSKEVDVPKGESGLGVQEKRPRGVPVTDEDIARVAELIEEGLGAVRISKRLNITASRAQHIMRKVDRLKRAGKRPDVGYVADEAKPESTDTTQAPKAMAPSSDLSPDEYARLIAERLRPVLREVIEQEMRATVTPMLDRVDDMTGTIMATADLSRLRRELATVGGMINRAIQRIESGVRDVV